jgi:hypothetical protein
MNPALFQNEGEPALPTFTDSVTIELHDPMNPEIAVESYKGILPTNGQMESYFSPATNGNSYYLVVKHRNTVETWSALPVTISTVSNYDFSTSASQAYGDNQVLMDAGNWAIFTGDIYQDENVDLLDLSYIEFDTNNFAFGYFATDINGDGNVDLLDLPLVEENISNFVFSNHPFKIEPSTNFTSPNQ